MNISNLFKTKVWKYSREEHIKQLEQELGLEEPERKPRSTEKMKVYVDDYNYELSIVRKILQSMDKDIYHLRYDTPESYRRHLFFQLELFQGDLWSAVLKLQSANDKIKDQEFRIEQIRKQSDTTQRQLRRAMRKLAENGIEFRDVFEEDLTTSREPRH